MYIHTVWTLWQIIYTGLVNQEIAVNFFLFGFVLFVLLVTQTSFSSTYYIHCKYRDDCLCLGKICLRGYLKKIYGFLSTR